MDYSKEYREQAERLQAELIAAGFMASRVEQGEGFSDWYVIFYDGTHDYRIKRDYKGCVQVTRIDVPTIKHVSSHARGELYKKNRGDNVKAITAKKVQRLIDAERAYWDELEALEAQASQKIADYIASVRVLERLGYKVTWSTERGGWRDGEIRGGSILKNGIEFTFEFCDDGYIRKDIKVHYSVENTLEAFGALADNKYRDG